MSNGYDLILSKAKELEPLGYLKEFKTDLTKYDRVTLERIETLTNNHSFLWAIKSNATFILTRYHFRTQLDNWTNIKNCYITIHQFFEKDENWKLFHFNGENLTEIKSIEDGKDILWSWEKNL